MRAMKHFFSLLLAVAALLTGCATAPAQLPADCRQAVIGIAEGWNDSHATLNLVQRNAQGKWVRVLGPLPARLGRNGLAWGRGLHTNPRGAVLKKEGDGRSPAGIFALGGLWVTNPTPVQHAAGIPYVKVGPNDLWVTDPAMPKLYNRWVRLDHPAATPWELHEQMRQTDYAHSIKMLVCHNTPERRGGAVVNGGSSIFFHIWRENGGKPTAGCTAMAEENLRALIARLNPALRPVYVLLPREEYARLRTSWQLP